MDQANGVIFFVSWLAPLENWLDIGIYHPFERFTKSCHNDHNKKIEGNILKLQNGRFDIIDNIKDKNHVDITRCMGSW